jgi:hypothetical protein
MADGSALADLQAPRLIRRAMRCLAEARALADDVAGRALVAEPEAIGRAISDLLRQAEQLLARAHG